MGLLLLLVIAGGLLFAVLVLFVMYNSLVGKKNAADQAFASVDVQLKKRYDLIPNLVNTVKQYMTHEASTLQNITELRAKATQGTLSSNEAVQLNNQITRAIGGIMVAVENYPQLRASENFQQLQRSLNEVEEQISAARRSFNAAITDYNNAVEMLPTNILAGMMGYKTRALFEIPQEERGNVNVGALFKS